MNEFLVSPVGLVSIGVVLLFVIVLIARLARGSDQAHAPKVGDLAAPSEGAASKEDAPSSPVDAGPTLAERMAQGLTGTRERLVFRMDELFRGRREIDEKLWTQLEELLVTSDVGINTATSLLEKLRVDADRDQLKDPFALRRLLQTQVRSLLSSRSGTIAVEAAEGPAVIVVVGVNGAGKTTTIGKIAARNIAEGRKVIIGAGDTFRAAAIDQLKVWADRAGADLVKHEEGSDPAAVIYDTVRAGVSRGVDLVICDTAGRLHTKSDLMDELQKIHRVVGKAHPGAPHEVLLVLDSTTGQNAVMQARQFAAAVGVTGIVLTKLDGTARGGVILSIADEFDIPVKLIGIGEGVDDLREFDPEVFVSALFGEQEAAMGRGLNSAAAAIDD